ncbi:MAG: flagellar biosynthetic protein FliQ [Alphaproteobacteria bacterium RIFOXYD12_FULL_60_8]|nr:MAG: flagellar biosynthetic protein FliQ [Alphaproteobacteria bacterium RIFOXYD12_FULL_60_8]
MNEAEVLEVARQGVLVMVIVSTPVLMTGLIIGLIISLFQALTSIQEMTLTFVPKIIAVFLSLIVFMPFMLRELTVFMNETMDRIVGLQ